MSELDAREQAVSQLSREFAEDRLSLDEFERRVAAVYAARSPREVAALVADIKPAVAVMSGSDVPSRLASSAQARIGAFIGSTERHGAITVSSQMEIRAVIGSVSLDLREAHYLEANVEMHLKAVLGSIELIVPPGVRVEWDGSSVLSSVEQVDDSPFTAPTRVLIRLTGRVLLGSIEIRTQLPDGTPLISSR